MTKEYKLVLVCTLRPQGRVQQWHCSEIVCGFKQEEGRMCAVGNDGERRGDEKDKPWQLQKHKTRKKQTL